MNRLVFDLKARSEALSIEIRQANMVTSVSEVDSVVAVSSPHLVGALGSKLLEQGTSIEKSPRKSPRKSSSFKAQTKKQFRTVDDDDSWISSPWQGEDHFYGYEEGTSSAKQIADLLAERDRLRFQWMGLTDEKEYLKSLEATIGATSRTARIGEMEAAAAHLEVRASAVESEREKVWDQLRKVNADSTKDAEMHVRVSELTAQIQGLEGKNDLCHRGANEACQRESITSDAPSTGQRKCKRGKGEFDQNQSKGVAGDCAAAGGSSSGGTKAVESLARPRS